jgi:hypothetical protein
MLSIKRQDKAHITPDDKKIHEFIGAFIRLDVSGYKKAQTKKEIIISLIKK